ncbi:MAG: ABC transporter permease, partial [Thaumarchaeota archaeon]
MQYILFSTLTSSAQMIPLVFGITFISFFIINLAPGDYLTSLKMNPQISPETI